MKLSDVISVIPALEKIKITSDDTETIFLCNCSSFRETMNDGSEYFNKLLNATVTQLYVNDNSVLTIKIER